MYLHEYTVKERMMEKKKDDYTRHVCHKTNVSHCQMLDLRVCASIYSCVLTYQRTHASTHFVYIVRTKIHTRTTCSFLLFFSVLFSLLFPPWRSTLVETFDEMKAMEHSVVS